MQLAMGWKFSRSSVSGGVVIKLPTRKIAVTLKEVEELTIPLDGVKLKLDGVVDSVPPDKGCEVLDGELTHA